MADRHVKTRLPPSPSGIGNVRAALFNYLLAAGRGGVFCLRPRHRYPETALRAARVPSAQALGLVPPVRENVTTRGDAPAWQATGAKGKSVGVPLRAVLTGARHGSETDRLWARLGSARARRRLQRAVRRLAS